MILDHIKSFPKIMGILNVTPDSFSDGGNFTTIDKAIDHCKYMIDNGAEIIDIGGESTRPGAAEVNEKEEIKRVIPVIQKIKKFSPNTTISVDSTKFNVIKASLDSGATIINDVSGLNYDPKILDLAIEYKSKLVIMHMQGKPKNMQNNPEYTNVVDDIFNSLNEKIRFCHQNNFKDIIIDVGIGFGKTLEHNRLLLQNLDKFKGLDAEQLIGLSRKSFLAKLFDTEQASERDLPTMIFHSLLLSANLDYIRVHNTNYINQLKKSFTFLK